MTWENPDQGNGSEIAGAYYKIGSAPETPTDGTRVSEDGLTQLDGLRVPRDGDWTLYVWLRRRGRQRRPRQRRSRRSSASTPPPPRSPSSTSAARRPRSGSRRPTGTAASPAGRSRSGGAASPSGGRSRRAARAPSSSPRSPTTSSSAARTSSRPRRSDAVGNTATTSLRADGREMVARPAAARRHHPQRQPVAPLRRRAARAGGRIRIGYRKRAWLRGVLRSGGALLPDTRLAIAHAPARRRRLAAAHRARHRRQRALPASGCRAGVSREVRVQFPGNRSLRPASDVVTLLRARLGEAAAASRATCAAAARSRSAAASASPARGCPRPGS